MRHQTHANPVDQLLRRQRGQDQRRGKSKASGFGDLGFKVRGGGARHLLLGAVADPAFKYRVVASKKFYTIR
jgi:hypothetical protein